MQRLNLKALSVNKAYRGRRFKTGEHKAFEQEVMLRAKTNDLPDCERLQVFYRFGFSSTLSDWDNPVKVITDILCKSYGIDDRIIFASYQCKVIVPKGEEFIEFKFMDYDDNISEDMEYLILKSKNQIAGSNK